VGGWEERVKNFRTKVPNSTPLRQNWSNKSFVVFASAVF